MYKNDTLKGFSAQNAIYMPALLYIRDLITRNICIELYMVRLLPCFLDNIYSVNLE